MPQWGDSPEVITNKIMKKDPDCYSTPKLKCYEESVLGFESRITFMYDDGAILKRIYIKAKDEGSVAQLKKAIKDGTRFFTKLYGQPVFEKRSETCEPTCAVFIKWIKGETHALFDTATGKINIDVWKATEHDK